MTSFVEEIIGVIEGGVARSARYHYTKTKALKQRIAILESAEQRHQGEIAVLLAAERENKKSIEQINYSLILVAESLKNATNTIETINQIYAKEKMKKPWWKFWK